MGRWTPRRIILREKREKWIWPHFVSARDYDRRLREIEKRIAEIDRQVKELESQIL